MSAATPLLWWVLVLGGQGGMETSLVFSDWMACLRREVDVRRAGQSVLIPCMAVGDYELRIVLDALYAR